MASEEDDAPRFVRARLTDREQMILTLLSQGYTNKEVARKLGMAHSTVKTHVEKIRTRFGAKNTSQAIYIAVKLGLIQ